VLAALQLPPTFRAEQLTVQQFAELHARLRRPESEVR